MTARSIHATLLLTAAAGIAHAGGFSTPIIGSRMIGRISFCAKADDTTAIFHNPAGLAFQEGYRADVSAISVYSHTIYRVAREDGTFSDAIEFDKPHGFLPFAGFAGDFGTDKWVFGVGLYSPHNTAASLPEDSEARFQLIEGRIVTLFLTPTAAYRVNDNLGIGFGVSLVTATAALKRWTDLEPATGLPIDALVEIEADDLTYAWDFGVMYRAGRKVTLGFDYQSPVGLDFEGDLTAVNDAIGLTARGDVGVDFTLPQAIRAAVNVQLNDRLDIGLDVYWQDYSVYKDLTLDVTHVTASIGSSTTSLGDSSIVEPKLSEDIYGIGIGGTYVWNEHWEASAGYLYDPSPYPNKTYTILSPDADKHGLAVGGGYNGKSWSVYLSYLRLNYKDRFVDDSILAKPANGFVEGKFNQVAALQVTYKF